MTVLFFFIIFSSIGWIMLIVGINARRYWMNRQERERTRTAGRIVAYIEKPAYKRRGVRHVPVAEFTAEARQQRLPCSSSFDPSDWPIGTSVEVIYDSDDPSRFHLDGEQSEAPGGRILRLGLAWITVTALLAGGIQSIGMKAFFGCLALRDVTIPASVTSIADDAFPEDCAATFHVAEGSHAEDWCRAKGFAVGTFRETTI